MVDETPSGLGVITTSLDEPPLSGPIAVGTSRAYGPYRAVRVLGRGGMAVVYEAIHATHGERVALKIAIRDSESSLVRLRAEIQALERVDHPGVVRLRDKGTADGVQFYAMELFEGVTWQEYTDALWRADESRPRPARPPAANGRLHEVLDHVGDLADALGHLHGLGLVHCDVSPRNVFVRADGRVVLMDLGLVSRHRGALGPEALEPVDQPTGTLGYMAPELAFGLSVDARADLYSLGAILYTALTGKPPLGHSRIAASRSVSDVPPELDQLLDRLLSPNRVDRPLTAADVAAALRAVTSPGLAPPSTPRARLFRSRVFGRDEALQPFARAIARSDTTGTFLLVGGESGIGKTTFAGMIARLAQIGGMRVVTGECLPLVPTGGPRRPGLRGPQLLPLRPLFDVAIDYALSHDAPAMRGALRSLRPFEPRVIAAFDEEGASTPSLSTPEAAKGALCADVAMLLAELARARPILLVLDDLQFADELSMSVLGSLPTDYFDRNRVVLVATYRVEQTDDLVRQLAARPYVVPLDLGPLGARDIRAMVSESCGFHVPEPWVQVLQDKALGNPFVAAEYLRAALDSGVLAPGDDARASEAAATFAKESGSIEGLIESRLSTLPPRGRLVAQAAAVIGNPVPRALLAEVTELPEAAVREETDRLVGRNLVEGVDAQHFRFMHDRLREVAYASAPSETRRALHRRAGVAIEARVHSDAARASIAPILAHHFVRGGGEDARALAYLELAADVAHRAFANREVVAFLTEALSLVDTAEVTRVAHMHFRLGSAYFGLGMLENSRRHLDRMLALLGFRSPSSTFEGALQCLRQVGRQTSHRLTGADEVDDATRARLLEVVSAYDMLMQVHFYKGDNLTGMLHSALAALNVAELAGPSPELRLAYANAQSTAAMMGLRGLARTYESLGRRSAPRGDDVALRTSAWIRQAAQHLIFGEWDEAEPLIVRVIEEARAVDYSRRDEEGVSMLAYMRFAQGRFDECRELCAGLYRSASRGDAQSTCWSIIFQAHTDLVADRAESAVAHATAGLALAKDLPGRSEALNLRCTLALGCLRVGDDDGAASHARAALDLMAASELPVFLEIVSYGLLAETTLGLVAGGRPGAGRLEADAFQCLERCIRLFPLFVPRAELWRGVRHWSARRPRAAYAAWQRGARAARAMRTPYEQTHADLLLELRPGSGVPRDLALARAEASFRRLGAAFDERAASEARGGPSQDADPPRALWPWRADGARVAR
jgi:tetratricopeptide (TPR) repeat protein